MTGRPLAHDLRPWWYKAFSLVPLIIIGTVLVVFVVGAFVMPLRIWYLYATSLAPRAAAVFCGLAALGDLPNAYRHRAKGWSAIIRSGAFILAAIIFAFSGSSIGRTALFLSARGQLLLQRDAYEKIVRAELPAKGHAGPKRYDHIDYEVHPGPPLRIEFQPERFFEDWTAIVHDPSGRAALATDWETWRTDRGPEDIYDAFGPVVCIHLDGAYFRCDRS